MVQNGLTCLVHLNTLSRARLVKGCMTVRNLHRGATLAMCRLLARCYHRLWQSAQHTHLLAARQVGVCAVVQGTDRQAQHVLLVTLLLELCGRRCKAIAKTEIQVNSSNHVRMLRHPAPLCIQQVCMIAVVTAPLVGKACRYVYRQAVSYSVQDEPAHQQQVLQQYACGLAYHDSPLAAQPSSRCLPCVTRFAHSCAT